MHDQLDRFCAEHPPTPRAASPVWAEATRLCEFASKLLAEGTLRPAWAQDLIRYERCVLDLTVSSESAASAILAAALIEACDGDRTIAGVAEQLSRTFGSGAKARMRVAAAIAQLRDAGVVGLRQSSKAAAVTPVRSEKSKTLSRTNV